MYSQACKPTAKSLVYSAPTGAGKTLVAEVLAIRVRWKTWMYEKMVSSHCDSRCVLQNLAAVRKLILFTMPFISLVQEKVSPNRAAYLSGCSGYGVIMLLVI